jgi:dTDP-4-dehydrorhamnose 3,5-epimerase
MEVIPTRIPDVKLLKPKVFGDERGYFYESFNLKAFKEAVDESVGFVQDNHSRSVRSTLRGLHYQLPPHPQGKLVRVTLGEVFDVAVDIRKRSPTFGQWVGQVLSADNKHQLWLPPGFAHGFLVTSEVAEFQYMCTDYYAPGCERGIRWDDPRLAIAWPIDEPPLISRKDADAKGFTEAEVYA